MWMMWYEQVEVVVEARKKYVGGLVMTLEKCVGVSWNNVSENVVPGYGGWG